MRASFAAVAVLALLQLGIARAGDDPHDRATLQGLAAVVVDVQPIDAATAKAGIDDAALKKDVELKLHLAGIRGMASPDEDVPPKERGVLSVTVSAVALPQDPGAYAYTVVVSLLQGVVMLRDLQTVVAAPTWWVAKNGAGEPAQIRGAVSDATEKFVTAYLSVNAKR